MRLPWWLLAMLLVASGCGNSSTQNELVGQVKKIKNQTPLICPDRVDVDVSLGVMRNGVGSMSTQDLWLTVPNGEAMGVLKKAAESGNPVKVVYDVRRVTLCSNQEQVTHAEILK